MRKLLAGLVVGIVLVAGAAYAALTVTLAGAATYVDPEWRAVCISNKPVDSAGAFTAGGQYTANIEVVPRDSTQGIRGRAITYTWSNGTLPAPAQTIVNFLITQWLGDNPEYTP